MESVIVLAVVGIVLIGVWLMVEDLRRREATAVSDADEIIRESVARESICWDWVIGGDIGGIDLG